MLSFAPNSNDYLLMLKILNCFQYFNVLISSNQFLWNSCLSNIETIAEVFLSLHSMQSLIKDWYAKLFVEWFLLIKAFQKSIDPIIWKVLPSIFLTQ